MDQPSDQPIFASGEVVLIGKQISNEDAFHLLCTAVTYRNWELSEFGQFVHLNSLCLLVLVIHTRRNTDYILFLSTVNDFAIHVPFMAYTSFFQCAIFCSWTPWFWTGNKLKDGFLLYTLANFFSIEQSVISMVMEKNAVIRNPLARNWKVKDGFSFRMQISFFLRYFFFFPSRKPFLMYCLSVWVGVGKLVVHRAMHNAVCLK